MTTHEVSLPQLSGLVKGMFVVDLDGTLLNSDRQISIGDLNTLTTLKDLGYLVVIATGRSNYSFEQLLKRGGYRNETDLPFDYVIFSTGAGVMDFPSRELLKSFSLSGEDISFAAHFLNTLELDYMIHRPVPDTRFFSFKRTGNENTDFTTRLKMYGEFAQPLTPENLAGFQEATEIICIVPADSGQQLARDIAANLKNYSVIRATSPLDGESVWIEIFPKTVSKSKAVQWLAEGFGMSSDSIAAVGNDYNDEDLLHWVEHGFIMANSPKSLQDKFQVVASNNEDGVSEAADRWLNDR